MERHNYTEAVARHLATRLHRTGRDVRCRCGQCRHQVIMTARRAGVAPAQLVAALPREGKPAKDGRRPRRASLSSQVAVAMTVTRGGRQLQGTAAVLEVLGVG